MSFKWTIPSNFVNRKIRDITFSDSSNGEARINIGTRSQQTTKDDFFNYFDPANIYEVSQTNLRDYLFSVKFEYLYQGFQKYKDISTEYWNEKFNELSTMTSFLITHHAHKIDSNNKYYASFKGAAFNFIRQIALPNITDLVIEKNGHKFTFLLQLQEKITLPFHREIEVQQPDPSPQHYFVEVEKLLELDDQVQLEINTNIDEVRKQDVVWLWKTVDGSKCLVNAGAIVDVGEQHEDQQKITIKIIKTIDLLFIDNLFEDPS